MPVYEYKLYDKDGNYRGEWEQLFKSYKDAKDKMEFQDDEGNTFYGEKQLSLIARTTGKWESAGWFEPGLGSYVKNSADRDRIAQAKGLVAQDDVSSNKHLHKDMMEKKIAYNQYWDARHEEYQTLLNTEMKKGFSQERAEQNASLEWSREDKLNEDKKHFSDKVANMKVPTNLNIK